MKCFCYCHKITDQKKTETNFVQVMQLEVKAHKTICFVLNSGCATELETEKYLESMGILN
ncbi:hypothetical protein B7P43_G15365 [Cryptotermes secundus]|uniref:Uncharacterized protein n=1 Tax=Cryptotermes secundus TaxID=105785 RepID=A0A2J7R9E9_9NEOP|nr:hypothetical protein B7P43_G15365 [Cryptotermes secundus]